MTALVAAAQMRPEGLILCSLSPFFKEDTFLQRMSKSGQREMGKARLEVFKRTSFNKIASRIGAKTYLLAGDKELKDLLVRVDKADMVIKKSTKHIIPGVDHDLSDKRYLEKIRKVISRL